MCICWPHIGKIVQNELDPTIEPLINLYLPKPFSKFRFVSADLGTTPLKVDRLTVHRRFQNSIALDLDVSFIGQPTLSMRFSPVFASFGMEEKALEWETYSSSSTSNYYSSSRWCSSNCDDNTHSDRYGFH